MTTEFQPIAHSEWVKGDYRMAASLSADAWSIESLAAKVRATLNRYEEDGLGMASSFDLRSSSGRQAAFVEYDHVKGPHLLLRLEGGTFRKSEVEQVLGYFGVMPEHVYWYAPEVKDA